MFRKRIKLEPVCNPLHDFLYNLSDIIKFGDRELLNRQILEMYEAITNKTSCRCANSSQKLVIKETYYCFVPDEYKNIITKRDFNVILFYLLNEYVNLGIREDPDEFSIFMKMYNEIREIKDIKNIKDKILLYDLFFINEVLQKYI